MERIRFKIHYSYILALASAVLFDNALIFMMCTVSMVLHELAHYFVARHRYYRCHKIQLSAFGAVLYGEFDNAYGMDQIVIALAGPIANIATCVLCCALWWIVPATYNYTYSLVSASATMAMVNMLPAYPLDGGRVLAGIAQLKGKDNGVSIARQCALMLSVGIFALFVVGLFVGVSLYNVALFAIFVYASSIVDSRSSCYTRLQLDVNIRRRLGAGVEKKVLVFDSNTRWGRVLLKLHGHYVYELHVVDKSMHVLGIINYGTLCDLLARCDSGATLADILPLTL